MLTQTWPGPPTFAAVFDEGDAAVLFGILGGGAAGAAFAERVAGAAAGAIPGLGGEASAAVPQDATPLWPLQAPDRVVPENSVPSLQVAVTVAVWA